ncbi:quinone-dependent dihydroorotate dehydrogenase [Psychrobacter sp. YP14]|jgi:dihydroorotate dehydrogenase|uniref:Dihydroorotate dehydrogenase (quinone) n=3 Tax=Psychrobacter TaxID=497 RepID=PYRD_PSYWF|nr:MULTISPECIES: quinone-dependent dihydroorotate dehydrogenase [Psychrobacter]A5WDZ3.1 RecName: Full=Dihydroorotate dehydrogenase (quinone); AltName: Full=DHOdehase; Short=DHOD; Short=DHODase; AltName: Full=Dihydroorotate oxidase [Psychrobacter sp. PRwf-1]AWT48905.1 quinone-dependent dihydroorotate dehydrogenase [Psychrobacter sp. YP14]MUG31869.1 quinone-dependent dihydroorotate dehydrogenase [Psychrobacter sanguinis]UNK06205.1 quinone-dependent dihydroorotate dehydrogenase [Psychrobacter sp. 
MSYALLRPFLFNLDPEHAHELTLQLLEKAHKARALGFIYSQQSLPTECMGLQFSNPVGLAAGLDKNGQYIDALAELGFGFIEVGTVTPRPQQGNEKPRLFRIKEADAIINRMGFNNLGVDRLIQNVQRAKYKGNIGINIGKNAVTPVENAADDYIYCLDRVYPHASYITVNISSPNTKNLRDLQSGEALTELLDSIKNRHSQLATEYGFYVPMVLKVAPDLTPEQVDYIANQLIEFDIDGLIATNTTLSRTGVEDLPFGDEAGGLSGRPVGHLSTQIIEQFYERLEGKVPIIGVGGIDSGDKAVRKLNAGATMIQLYSGMIYQGPKLVQQCVEAITSHRDAMML